MKRYTIVNLKTGAFRGVEVESAPPVETGREPEIDTQRLQPAIKPPRLVPEGVELSGDEVIFDPEREVIDWAAGEVVQAVEPVSNHVYREFLGLKAEVERLTERIAEVEERLEEFEEVR